jgi:hypothetical protein
VLTLTEDAGVGTDLVVQPGQTVVITGDARLAEAPSWGKGGFTVGEMGSLALKSVQLRGPISVLGGGSVALSFVAIRVVEALPLSIADGGIVATTSVSLQHGDVVVNMELFDAGLAAGTCFICVDTLSHYPHSF